MKVDVYPNITNVEVYENPISVPVEATWEKVTFLVANPVVNTFDLGREVATDRDGDFVLQVSLNGVQAEYGDDFTLDGSVISWVSQQIALESDEELVIWYSPKTIYGSVPGSGEVSSLNDLNDVVLAGPQAGQVLVRDGNGDFANKFLNAGDNVTITSNANGVTIAANPSAGSSDGAQGVLQTSDGNNGFSAVNWSISNNHLIPSLDSQYDIGSVANKVRDIYMSGNTLYIGDGQISVNGDAIQFAQGLQTKTLATTDDVSPDTLVASSTFVSAVTGPQGPQGPQGLAGANGADGANGAVGPQGPQGPQGDVGSQGLQGVQGDVGPQGLTGPSGADGADGSVGSQGPQGIQGVAGAVGPQGLVGEAGADGADGSVGSQGPQGLQGIQGPQGSQGDAGADGAVGPQGNVGPQGTQGSQGLQGDTGPQGDVGPQGPQGVAGPQGPQGLQGDAGAQGSQGSQGVQGVQGVAGSGVTFKGSVSSDPSGSGVVTLTNAATFTPSQGDAVLSQVDDSLFIYSETDWVDGGSIQGPQGIQGVAGPQGPQGAQGIQGVAGSDGADGADGSVGPQGAQGLQGVAGATGPQGSTGADGNDGSIGPQGPQGPQGLQGDVGATGPQGVAGADGNDGSTGPQGPQGLQGDAGAQGPQGVAGADGSQGPAGASGAAGASVTTLAISNNTVATALSDGTNISGSVAMNLTSLSDVDITDTAHTLSDGYVLTYDSTHSHWHPESPTEITAGAIAVGDSSVTIADTGTNGNINFTTDGTSRWDVTSAGHMIPATSEDYDIGNASNKVRHLFLSDNSVKLASGDIGADAEGDLTYTKTGETVSKVATQTGNLLTVKGDTTSAAIKLNCEDNSHGVTIQSPAHSEQASYTLTLPSDTGSPDQVLKTDGSGGLGWVDQSGGGGSSRPKMLLYTQNNISPSYYMLAVQDFIDYEGIVFDYDKTNSSATGPSAMSVYLPNIATNNLEGYSFIIHNGFDTSNASPMYAKPSSPEKIYRPNYTSLRTTVTVPEQASMTFYATANGYWLTNPKT